MEGFCLLLYHSLSCVYLTSLNLCPPVDLNFVTLVAFAIIVFL